jgi:hypothetical protein
LVVTVLLRDPQAVKSAKAQITQMISLLDVLVGFIEMNIQLRQLQVLA